MPPLAPRKPARTEAGETAPRMMTRSAAAAAAAAAAAPPRLVLRFKRKCEEADVAAPGAPRKRAREEADEALFQPSWALGGLLPGFEEEEADEALFQPSWAPSPHHLSSLGGGSPLPVRSARLPDLPRRWGSLGGSPYAGGGAGAAPLRSDSLMLWARGGSLGGGSPCFSLGSLGGSPFAGGGAGAAPLRSDSLAHYGWEMRLPPSPLGASAAAPLSTLEVLGGLCEVSPRIPLAGMAEPPPVQRLRLRFSDSLGGAAASLGSPLFAAAPPPPLYVGSPLCMSSLGGGEAASLGSPLFAAAASPPLYLGLPFRVSSLGGAAASPPVFVSSGGLNLEEALAAESSLQ